MKWPAAGALILGTLTTAWAAQPAMFRADARHGGVYDGAGVPALHGVKWKFKTGAAVISTPAVAAGVLYFGSTDHNFYALDAASGAKRWLYSAKGSWVIASPAVRDNKVYFATSDSGLLLAVNAKTGAPAFSLSFNHWPFFSSPALSGERLYIGSHAGKLIAIDLRAQQVAWTFATDGAQKNAPALTKADGTPNYEAAFRDFFYDDLVVGVDRMMSVGAVLSSPVIDGGTLYFGSWDGQLYAIG